MVHGRANGSRRAQGVYIPNGLSGPGGSTGDWVLMMLTHAQSSFLGDKMTT